jgi:5-methylcytosine-specific restriction endonuclease McrA
VGNATGPGELMPMRLCSGCGTKIPDGRGPAKCEACKQPTAPVADGIRVHTLTDRERFAWLYKSERWKRGKQPQILRRDPFCKRCETAMSEIVDHIVPVGVVIVQAQESGLWPFDKWAGFFLDCNLQGLCRKCHAEKTDEDKQHIGPWEDVIAKHKAASKKAYYFA